MFAVITIVQLIVVARGAERVAEVAARFALDAMPGKQMAIDAELRAGAIDAETARARRAELERESQLYGAMDGAMRFVKGDAIAAIVIVVINLVGGLVIGVGTRGMSAGEAVADLLAALDRRAASSRRSRRCSSRSRPACSSRASRARAIARSATTSASSSVVSRARSSRPRCC